MNDREDIAVVAEGSASDGQEKTRSAAAELRQASGFPGRLIVNADDWGRDRETTDRTLDCVRKGTISGVSAMVFMEESERAAELAREEGIDAGLHLNFTTPLTAKNCPGGLAERQQELSAYLRRTSILRVFYNPWLKRSFEYVVAAQLEEYQRRYGAPAERIDGHHHQHLGANVQFQNLLPAGTLVRRNFSFMPGEKSFLNRWYRKTVDQRLARRHVLVDYLFSLAPMEEKRLERIFSVARNSVVELETHPVNREEHQFLTGDKIFRLLGNLPISPNFTATVAASRRAPCSMS